MINKNIFVRVMSSRSMSAYHWCRTEHRSRPNHRGLKGEGHKHGVRLVRICRKTDMLPALAGYRPPICKKLSGPVNTSGRCTREDHLFMWDSDVTDEGWPDVSLRFVRGQS